jgi:heparan-alpha-glucosaminide N-acetyltransferase
MKTESVTTSTPSLRLQSLDAYRGLIMVSLAFGGFGIAGTARLQLAENPESGFWSFLQYQTTHVQWIGCSYWDLIQPSFMFMVGLSMAYSYVKRQREGHSYRRMLGHAIGRSVILIVLGIFLTSPGPLTRWWFTNVLTQIGLGYTFLFLLWGRSVKTQAIVAVGVLVATWLTFVLFPGKGLDLATAAPDAGVSPEWAQRHLGDVDPAWHKNANVAHAFDVWLLNLMPKRGLVSGGDSPSRSTFTANPGGYQTLNFLPSLVTMLFGLMVGELLRSKREESAKLRIILAAGVIGLVLGWLLGVSGISPMVKRIWTPSWTLFSTGWCCLILGGLYGVIDIKGHRNWTFPLTVVGMNSIAIYCMDMLLKSWVGDSLKRHFGDGIFLWAGPQFEPMVQATLTGLCFWLICWWMYRQKLFVRI